MVLAYRYRLVSARGAVSGGELYEGRDGALGARVAVIFVSNPSDRAAVKRFVDGYRLFGELRSRGLAEIREVARVTDPRPYAVMDWLDGGVLEQRVAKQGALEPVMVWSLIADLLTGVSAAHRSLPALVHGHIHPGKVGFTAAPEQGGEAVLFGYEWAREVAEQDSSLADSFSADAATKSNDPSERATVNDMRLLARTIAYAATGRWIGDGAPARQRDEAKSLLGGPLGLLVERMLLAGTDEGYPSIIHARDDFELLRSGVEGGRRPRPQPRAAIQAAVTSPVFASARSLADAEDDDADDENDEIDELDAELERESSSILPTTRSQAEQRRAARPPVAGPPPQKLAEMLEQLDSQQQGGKKKSGCLPLVLFAVGLSMVGFFVSVLEESEQPQPPPPQVITYQPPEPIEQPMPEPVPVPEPVLPETPPTPAFERQMWPAEVIESSGSAPAKRSRCELWVEPEVSGYNSRWRLDCETKRRGERRRYYGTGTAGFGYAELDEQGVPIFVQDLADDDGDGSFVFDGRREQPALWVADRFANPPFAFVARVDVGKGGPRADEVPATTDVVRSNDVGERDLSELSREYTRLGQSYALLPPDEGAVENEAAEIDDAELPDRLSVSDLEPHVQALEDELNGCEGLRGLIRVSLEIEGATGTITSFSLDPAASEEATQCVDRVLSAARLGRFREASMTVSFSVTI